MKKYIILSLLSPNQKKAATQQRGMRIFPYRSKTLSIFKVHSYIWTDHNLIHNSFYGGTLAEKEPTRIVYFAAAFDIFRGEHINILEQAKKLGDYLIVGVHGSKLAR